MEQAEAVTAAVARVLGAGFSGHEVIDRDLVLGQGERIPFVLADEVGRLVLVLTRGADDGGLAIAALDALDGAQRYAPALAEHLASARVDTSLAPMVWVVARELSKLTRERLERAAPGQVRLFELVRIESRRGAGEYLTELGTPARAPGAPGAVFAGSSGPAAVARAATEAHPGSAAGTPSAPSAAATSGLAALAPALRALEHSISRRLERLDDAVRAERSSESVLWRFDGEVIASLAACGGKLHAMVPELGFDASLEGSRDVEAFLGAAVERYLGLLGQLELIASPRISPREPLLTPEELAHFDPRN